jgi:ribonucleoside-diphosphate reductase alpha chain
MSEINVTKRDGTIEPLNYEKIHTVLYWATEGRKKVSVSDIEINAKLQLYDGIPTTEIHKVLIKSASEMISPKSYNYQYVAARLLNYYLRKEIFGSVHELPHLHEVIQKNIDYGVYDKEILEKYTIDEIDEANDYIKHERDHKFAYAGLQQLVDKYLIQDRRTKIIYETPQYMYIMIAMTLFGNYDSAVRMKFIRKFYNSISTFKISLPTPIMCGVRTPNRQYSSCTLIDVDDSLKSIYNSNSAVGFYISKRAGIGLNFGRLRGIGSFIRGGEVVHTGVIPFLKVFESTTKSCTQNGVRGGNSTTHFPFWHQEIQDILVLKNNRGTDDNRVRKMDYSIQLCRLFYRRVKEDGYLSLFSPHDVPELTENFGIDNDKFEEYYEKYEKKNSIKKKRVKARDLFNKICQERIGTGRIYIMNIDHCNTHSAFQDKVWMSNLCQEITLPTTPLTHIDDNDDTEAEIGLCTLSAINLGEVNSSKLSALEEICEQAVRALDFVIENQDYPVAAARKMLKRRSLGIGITNLAYYLAKHGEEYGSQGSLELIDEVMEHIQYYCIKASVKLAKEFGPCEWFHKTKYSKGLLPVDTYNRNVDKLIDRPHTLDWDALREEVLTFGMRNSTLLACMPCESSSVVTNSTNGIEPPRDLMSIKKSKHGLLKTLVPEVHRFGHNYTLAWEMEGNKPYLMVAAVIQKWVDQAISCNNYYDFSKYDDGNISIADVAHDIMFHYNYGGKTLYYAVSNDGKDDDGGCASGGCSV